MPTSATGQQSYEEARVTLRMQNVRAAKRKLYIGLALIAIAFGSLIASGLSGYSAWLDNVDQGSTVPQLLVFTGSLIAWIAMAVIGALMALAGLHDTEQSKRALTAAIEELSNAPTAPE